MYHWYFFFVNLIFFLFVLFLYQGTRGFKTVSQSVSILSALDIAILPINWFPSTTDMLDSLSCETLLWLYFVVATPVKLPCRYLCIYMSTNGYVLSLFLAVFLRFFPFGSPSFLVIVLHFDLYKRPPA